MKTVPTFSGSLPGEESTGGVVAGGVLQQRESEKDISQLRERDGGWGRGARR